MTSRPTKILNESAALTDTGSAFGNAAVVAITITDGPLTITRTDATGNTVLGSIVLPDGLHFLQKAPTELFEASANGAVGTSVAY